ncbi:hypothetical protein ACGFNU_16085 [Spirillospora sp. NPDC048911]|uniref:hypothetical protein n=1 Tax=Spirillospora sp. NPDC048911 TaxID=3364527 RepID=UPI003717C0BE
MDPGQQVQRLGLAAAAGDGAIWLWNLGRPRSSVLTATWSTANDALYTNGFTRARSILVTGGVGREVQLWNTDVGQVIDGICATAGTQITRAEWQQYLPDRQHEPPCDP